MRRWMFIAAGLLAAATAQAAPPTSGLPPGEMVLPAIETTPEVHAAEAVLARAEAEAAMRRVGPHEATLTVIPQRRRVEGAGRYREWEADLTRGVRWPHKARLDREIGTEGAEAARLLLEDAHHAAARRLLALWSDWLRADAALHLRRGMVDDWQRDRDAVARRVRLGDAAERDRIAVDAALAQAQAAALQAEAALADARLALASAFPDLPLPERPHLPADAPVLDGTDAEWTRRIVERSHEIGAAAARARQKQAEARRARADRLPDPSIGLRVLDDLGGRERALGVVFSIPLGGRYRGAQAAAAGADALGAEAELSMVRRDVARDAQRTVAMARAAHDIWQRQQAAWKAARDSAAKAGRAYALGESGLAELLAARRAGQELALDEARARVDALEAVTRVEVDAHERWHRHGAGDEASPVGGATLPRL